MDTQTTGAATSPVTLTDDEIAVYRAFLAAYSNGSAARLNVGNRTTPFKLSEGDRAGGCLKGVVLQDVASAQSVSRALDAEIVVGTKAALVDPEEQSSAVKANDPSIKIRRGETVDDAVAAAFASGLLQLSNIVFDQLHRYAVLRFSFSCGMLCGHGGTVVFQKSNGRWKATNRRCTSWIS
jgi:hypothetical protein